MNLEDSQVLLITRSEPHLEGVLGPGAGSAVRHVWQLKIICWCELTGKQRDGPGSGVARGKAVQNGRLRRKQLRTGPKSHSSFPVS